MAGFTDAGRAFYYPTKPVVLASQAFPLGTSCRRTCPLLL